MIVPLCLEWGMWVLSFTEPFGICLLCAVCLLITFARYNWFLWNLTCVSINSPYRILLLLSLVQQKIGGKSKCEWVKILKKYAPCGDIKLNRTKIWIKLILKSSKFQMMGINRWLKILIKQKCMWHNNYAEFQLKSECSCLLYTSWGKSLYLNFNFISNCTHCAETHYIKYVLYCIVYCNVLY